MAEAWVCPKAHLVTAFLPAALFMACRLMGRRAVACGGSVGPLRR
jgi:hypothetical protein